MDLVVVFRCGLVLGMAGFVGLLAGFTAAKAVELWSLCHKAVLPSFPSCNHVTKSRQKDHNPGTEPNSQAHNA